jgi:hypothetical protein
MANGFVSGRTLIFNFKISVNQNSSGVCGFKKSKAHLFIRVNWISGLCPSSGILNN